LSSNPVGPATWSCEERMASGSTKPSGQPARVSVGASLESWTSISPPSKASCSSSRSSVRSYVTTRSVSAKNDTRCASRWPRTASKQPIRLSLDDKPVIGRVMENTPKCKGICPPKRPRREPIGTAFDGRDLAENVPCRTPIRQIDPVFGASAAARLRRSPILTRPRPPGPASKA